jgi:hypothetical protein
MAPGRHTSLIAVALLTAVPVRAATDAVSAFDDFSVKSAIIAKCHPSESPADRAYLAKGDAFKRAAAATLKAKLDASDPAHKSENAKKAEDELAHRLEARAYDIDEQIRNYGCPWLDGQLYAAGQNQ